MKYEKDKIVTGFVTGIEKYGIFVSLDDYYSGLIHISEISPKYVKNIEKYANIGENIRMKVIDVDDEKHQLKLSIKNLNYRSSEKDTKIEETPLGFSTLKEKLPIWIDKKLKELKNEKI